jgi:polysaccharide pyruvyl transferase WcaK-like protein
MEKGDLVRESDEIRKIAACFDGCEIIFVHLSTKNDEKNPGMKIVINDLLEYSKTKENTRFVIGCDQDRASQEERAKEIVARFSPDRALFLPYSGPWMLSSVLGHVDKVVTDKLHVGIVATRLGKYVISVPFHTKTIRFYNQLNIPDRCKMLSDVNGGDVYDLLVSDADNGVENVEAIIELAKTNYSLLEEFLEKV